MGDWSDSEKSAAAKPSQKQQTNNDDDWGDSEKNTGFESKNDDFSSSSNSYSNDNNRRGGRGGSRGRGRGRGRGGFDNNDNRQNGEYKPRNNNNNEEGSEYRSRRRDNNEEGDDSRAKRRENNNEEGGEEKKREIYIPIENDESDLYDATVSAGINFDKLGKVDVKVSGEGEFTPITSFEESGLRDYLLQNVKKSGYSKPTPIQKYAIPIIMEKRDLMGCAQTGSGKTAAFLLPILHNIMQENRNLTPGKPQCLIVAPTRELVIQIYDEARKFSIGSWVKVCLAYGGAASNHQSNKIGSGCHLLVATPGRLMDFVNKGIISFDDLKFLVLDEADRMLDMGFRDSIEKICAHETITKEGLTTLMFSATFPEEIQRLAGAYLRDYIFLTVGIIGGACPDVEQEFFEVTKFKKRERLREILNQYVNNSDEDRILVFVETKRTADYLASLLTDTQISTTSIHGDRTQSERETALREFRKGERKVLIATAVAARGLDIRGVTHVINYDLPKDIEEYVHRIGRTGRVGNRGKATSFFDPENDGAISASLVTILKQADQPIPAFFTDSGVDVGPADDFGASDIRRSVPVQSAQTQQTDEDW
ncbi:hypothetical protein PVAND_001126 [Polypedilum vanderplanki]|uniref:RNA helicase n=1 Tax=Polypedilum vanderplanki TaxID=319348 RepID=A0A9J6BML2_POLVA|nr:hypothetical protein PVAND_001126 [Polypedilum vanderplanki]